MLTIKLDMNGSAPIATVTENVDDSTATVMENTDEDVESDNSWMIWITLLIVGILLLIAVTVLIVLLIVKRKDS